MSSFAIDSPVTIEMLCDGDGAGVIVDREIMRRSVMIKQTPRGQELVWEAGIDRGNVYEWQGETIVIFGESFIVTTIEPYDDWTWHIEGVNEEGRVMHLRLPSETPTH